MSQEGRGAPSESSFPPPRERKRGRQPDDNAAAREEGRGGSRSPDATPSPPSDGRSTPSFVDVDGAPRAGVDRERGGARGGTPEADLPDSDPDPTRGESGGMSGMSGGGPLPAIPSPFVESRRMKQPTLAVYGVVSDTAVLKKELARRDAEIEELKDRLQRGAAELAQRGRRLDAAERRAGEVEAKLHRFQAVMRGEMLRAAVQGRNEARRVLHQKHFEIGQIVTWAGNPRQMWVEGSVMCGLIRQLDEITRRRDAVEQLKKAAHANVKHLLRQERDREESTPGSDAFLALMEAQEELQLRAAEHAALTARIAAIRQRQAELENEKKAFVKEIRRIHDEDASEYVSRAALGEGERYILMYLLGKGGFSEVWRAFDMAEGRYVACKIHHINRDWPLATRQNYRRRAERELEIMRVLQHPHLTRLHDVFPLSETAFVSVMEYSAGVDLDTYLKRYQQLREADARLILLQVVAALRYLAGLPSPVIHYDLKPANILLHSGDPGVLEVKLTDFGLSKLIGEAREGPSDNPTIELTSQGAGTYWYLPPECFDTAATPRISNKVDVWSVGVIFYQMLFGRRPFAEGESQRKIWQERLIIESARTLRFPETPKVSDEARELISNCLAFDVAARYDVFQLSQHPYLFRTGRRSARGRSSLAGAATSSGATPPQPATNRERMETP